MKKGAFRDWCKKAFEKIKGLSSKQWLLLAVALAIVMFGAVILTNPNPKDDEPKPEQKAPTYGISRICELATLECYYHNVTEWSKEANWIGYGGKKIWIEYDGVIRAGIPADQLIISEPDTDNVVTVTLPAAIVLDKDLDENSIYEIDSERHLGGWIPITSSVTTEDRAKALSTAQKEMENTASKDRMILSEARERAKLIIERNIKAAGEAQGIQYTVKFIDAE